VGLAGVGSLHALYNYYNDMTYFGNYSHEDIGNMYPFERDIYLGMLKTTLKEIKESKERN
jgi:hypothetical protein